MSFHIKPDVEYCTDRDGGEIVSSVAFFDKEGWSRLIYYPLQDRWYRNEMGGSRLDKLTNPRHAGVIITRLCKE